MRSIRVFSPWILAGLLALAVTSCNRQADRCSLRLTDEQLRNISVTTDEADQNSSSVEWSPLAPADATDPREDLARCLNARGAVLYGTWWCGACRRQKEMFGPHAELLNYVECTPQDQPREQRCLDLNINSVPTWIFQDGTRVTGRQSLQRLAELSGCPFSEN
ncbi:hypothetical protein KKF05_00705 [Patescibacteria group bacterium]|nr:hypothetical protein [Patescibacteria group bacterium]MBU1028753.1 hypothetical protein [Patescibacteria group bacterium]MBU1916106.1 hypothetical protein [Patescibacteria group bacterium]